MLAATRAGAKKSMRSLLAMTPARRPRRLAATKPALAIHAIAWPSMQDAPVVGVSRKDDLRHPHLIQRRLGTGFG